MPNERPKLITSEMTLQVVLHDELLEAVAGLHQTMREIKALLEKANSLQVQPQAQTEPRSQPDFAAMEKLKINNQKPISTKEAVEAVKRVADKERGK